MKIAIVGLNSLYSSGASSFMMHLVYDSDWDFLVFNSSGKKKSDDFLLSNGQKVSYMEDSKADVLESYDAVIIGALRWSGGYDFLKKVKFRHVGIVVHDHLDFTRMGFYELMNIIPNATVLYMYSAIKQKLSDMHRSYRIRHPFAKEVYPSIDGISFDRDRFVCMSRFVPSKNHAEILNLIGNDIPLHIYGIDMKSSLFSIRKYAHDNVFLHTGVNDWTDRALAYSRAIASIDATRLHDVYDAVQYTTLEAWAYGVVPIVTEDFMCDEVKDGNTCLLMSSSNINRIYHNVSLQKEIINNGFCNLPLHYPSNIRHDILEIL